MVKTLSAVGKRKPMSKNKTKAIFLSLVFVLPVLLLGGYSLMVSTVFSNATPSAKLKITVSSEEVALPRMLSAIEGLQPALSPVVNKHEDTRYEHKFMFYKHALWFPQNDSKYYGISLIEWDALRWESGINDENDKKGLYLISVFSEESDCGYCVKLTDKLNQLGISYNIDSAK